MSSQRPVRTLRFADLFTSRRRTKRRPQAVLGIERFGFDRLEQRVLLAADSPAAAALVQSAALTVVSAPAVQSGTEGGYSYTITNGQATITRFVGTTSYPYEISIPATINGAPVTAIGARAFADGTISGTNYWTDPLTRVTIPEGVTSIGEHAFFSSDLKQVVLPSTLTSLGAYAFSNCSNLKAIELPTGLTQLPEGCFYESGLVGIAIPSGVTSIGPYAFTGCYSLDRIQVPASVTQISATAFSYVGGLGTKYYFLGAPPAITGNLGYSQQSALTWGNVYFPTGTGGWPASYGGLPTAPVDMGFTARQVGVGLNAGVYITGYNGVANRLTIPETIGGFPVKAIDDSAFAGREFVAVSLPANCSYVNAYAFANCPALREVTIGWDGAPSTAGLYLAPGAFGYCSALRDVYFLGNAPPSSGVGNAFSSGNFKVYYRAGKTGWSDTASWSDPYFTNAPKYVLTSGFAYRVVNGEAIITEYKGTGTDVTIPNALDGRPVTGIDSNAFSNQAYLQSITLPAGLKTIGNQAFSGCSSLAAITLPEGLVTIGDLAFWGSKIQSLALPSSVTSVGYGLGSALLQITAATGSATYSSQGGILFSKDLAQLVQVPAATAGSVTVPAGVTSLANGALYSCKSVTAVSLPASLRTIGDSAFTFCSSLTSIAVPEGVTRLPVSVFEGCTGLTAATLPTGLTAISDQAFFGCNNLAAITLPMTVSSIGASSFRGCLSLTAVTLPAALDRIGQGAFGYCPLMQTVTFLGNAPTVTWGGGSTVFDASPSTPVRYRAGTTGWTSSFSGRSTQSFTLALPATPSINSAVRGDRQATLAWSMPPGSTANVTDYVIYYKGYGDWTLWPHAPSTAQTATITGLTNGTHYYFKVQALAGPDAGVPSAVSARVVPMGPPSAPRNVQATFQPAGAKAQVALRWLWPADRGGGEIQDFKVQIRQGQDAWADVSKSALTFANTLSSAVITGLDYGVEYSFRLAAVNFEWVTGSGWTAFTTGAFSDPVTVTPVGLSQTPTQVSAVLAGQGSVDLRWYPPTITGGLPVTSYLVRCSSNSGQTWSATIPTASAQPSQNYMNIQGLTAGLPWVFSVAAVTSAGTGTYSFATAPVTVVLPPGAPAITSAVLGDRQVTLGWAAPSTTGGAAITDYVVQYSSNAGATWTTFVRPVASTATSNVVVNGLVNGVTYVFKVAAKNFAGTGDFSSPSSAVAPGTVPGTPAAPVAKIGDKSITLTWTVPSSGGPPISGYTVRYSIAGANVWTSITPDAANVSAPTPTTRALTISGLTNDTPYVFNVAAFNQLGYGPYSSNSAAVTPLAPAAAPTGLTATRGDRSATVAFTAPVVPVNTPILGYQLQSSRDGLVWSNVKWPTAVPVLQTSAVLVGGLANGTAFQLRVAAVTAAGVGAFSNPVSVTPATLPGTVTGAPRAVIANGAATLTWNRPSSDGGSPIVDYVVQYAIAGSPTWTSFSHAPADVKSPTSTSRSIVVNGLDNGTNYVFRVAAINDVGQAAAFSPNSSGATPLGPPGTPTDLAATRGNASATLSWTAPADNGGSPITRYLIQSSRDGGVTWTAAKWPTGVDATATQNVVVTGLTNGTAYQFRIAAIAGTRQGSFSSPINVTPATVPGTVSAAPAGSRSDAAVVLTWNAPTSTGGSPIVDYVVQYTFSGSPTWIPFIHAPADVTSPTATRRSITVTGLANRTAYVFRVAAVNDVGTAAAFSPSSAPVILNVP